METCRSIHYMASALSSETEWHNWYPQVCNGNHKSKEAPISCSCLIGWPYQLKKANILNYTSQTLIYDLMQKFSIGSFRFILLFSFFVVCLVWFFFRNSFCYRNSHHEQGKLKQQNSFSFPKCKDFGSCFSTIFSFTLHVWLLVSPP